MPFVLKTSRVRLFFLCSETPRNRLLAAISPDRKCRISDLEYDVKHKHKAGNKPSNKSQLSDMAIRTMGCIESSGSGQDRSGNEDAPTVRFSAPIF